MTQTVLNDEAGEALVGLNNDLDAALRYLDGDTIERANVERWRDEVKKILAGRVVRAHGGGRKRQHAPAAAVG
jgi:hypothetical protein